jgi:uncharacterized protein YndB with AHSA1/START domain
MRKKLLIVFAVLLAVVALLVGFVAMQPSEFTISRSATIAAPPAEVFPHVNDFHRWQAWSPWAELDPNAKAIFEGPSAGEGAVFKWSGNDEIGEGSMKIIESRPHELIRIRLAFVRPFEDTSNVEFTFQPEDDQTLVTWTMFGRQNFIGKAVCLFMDMETMLGGQFDQGLAKMKAAVENDQRPNASDSERSDGSGADEAGQTEDQEDDA